ncbi:MAG: ATP-binding cassette domain-containing protein [Leptospiraceae bacterium]|nr:ABC transporter ATP-binding protein [Leptospiraceae bacterium]MCK6382480.1 ATP-binding cassette domain-containing protein [Leptospiraceae bacterium]NUM41933.1 ABC transporter ATP-binding protein [Leptospiraceae bacterium]
MKFTERLIEVSKLEIEDIGQNKKILSSFDFVLNRGEVHSVIGESGSGKSTFALSLFSLLAPNLNMNYEQFLLFGNKISNFTKSDWGRIRGKKISLIPQNTSVSFHPYMKIGTQIIEFLNYKSDRKITISQIIHSFEEVGIQNAEEKIFKFPKEVSGGERQRILIASSVLVKPEILVADEPTSSMDLVNRRSVISLIKKIIKTTEIGIVLVTHDMSLVKELSDKVTVLKNGDTIEKLNFKNKKVKLKTDYSKSLFSLSDFYKHSC